MTNTAPFVLKKDNIPFEAALTHLKAGKKIARKTWFSNEGFLSFRAKEKAGGLTTPAWIDRYLSDGDWDTWRMSVTDILAEDWFIVE